MGKPEIPWTKSYFFFFLRNLDGALIEEPAAWISLWNIYKCAQIYGAVHNSASFFSWFQDEIEKKVTICKPKVSFVYKDVRESL